MGVCIRAILMNLTVLGVCADSCCAHWHGNGNSKAKANGNGNSNGNGKGNGNCNGQR